MLSTSWSTSKEKFLSKEFRLEFIPLKFRLCNDLLSIIICCFPIDTRWKLEGMDFSLTIYLPSVDYTEFATAALSLS